MTIYTTFNKTITLLPTTQPSPINSYNHLPIPSTTSYKHQLLALIKHNIPLRNSHLLGFTYTQLWDNNLPSATHPIHSLNRQVTQWTYIHAHGNCSPQTQDINNYLLNPNFHFHISTQIHISIYGDHHSLLHPPTIPTISLLLLPIEKTKK